MEKFGKVQNTVLSLLGHNLFSAPLTLDPDVDWAEVLRESKMQAVLLVAFKNHKELPLDQNLRAGLEKRLMMHTVSNVRCFQDHTCLHSIMEKGDVHYCVLKGAASAYYYPDPLLRAMGDVDFYVPPAELEKATEQMLEAGFERVDHDHRYHRIFKKGKTRCEMHFEPIALPKGKMGKVFWDYWNEICESAALVKDELAEFRMPSPFLHGFVLLSHFQSHLLFEGVGLRHICDFVVFADSFSGEEFVEIFEVRLKQVGMWKLAQTLGLIAVEYMGMPYRAWMGDDRNTARELLADILAGGNFGRKDRQRAYEGFFIAEDGTAEAKNNGFSQAIRSLNRLIETHWPVAKKCFLLYPVGWVFFPCRYMIRRLLGKRKVSLWKSYRGSQKRKDLYQKLKLLKPEK